MCSRQIAIARLAAPSSRLARALPEDHRRTAVDNEVLPVDPSGLVRGAEQRGVRDVLGPPWTSSNVVRIIDIIGALSPRRSIISCIAGIRIGPGEIELARIPYCAPSAASWRVNAMMPPFANAWAVCLRSRVPIKPAIDAVLMMTPLLAAK